MYRKIVSTFVALCIFTMHSLFLVSPSIAIAQGLSSETLVTESASIVISAVQITGGVGKTGEDFIELYNASSEPVDLNGFRLVKRTATAATDTSIKAWSSETIVQPHHFYLWANSGYVSLTPAADATTSSTLADNNGIALRQGDNDAGLIYNSVAWGNTANGFENVSTINPAAGESLTRSDLEEINSTFNIQTSNPRNSSIEFIPDELPIEVPPIDEEPPVEEEPPIEEAPPVEDSPPIGEIPPAESAPIDIKITEILPNPTGEDSGFEKIELLNAGIESVNLAGYTLDDVSSTEPISSNAYVLPSSIIAPNEYLVITIPIGKFALNNTDGDVVTLFAPDDEVLSSISYTGTAPENESYSTFSSGWQWASLTFGQSNGQPPSQEEENDDDETDEEESEGDADYDNSGLIISEIFPHPESKDGEFVEIYNSGTKTAQLSKISIWVGARHKLLPSFELKPGKYYAIEQASLPVQLRNSGQEVRVLEETKTLSTVTYPNAVKGASFAVFEDGFLWTTAVTKTDKNILQLPEEIKKKSEVAAAKTVTNKVDKKPASREKPATKKTSVKATTAAKPSSKSPVTKDLKPKADDKSIEAAAEQGIALATVPSAQKTPLGKIIAMGAAAVIAGIIALYKLVFTPGGE